jgi:endonuclease III
MDVDVMLARVEAAVAPYPKAALFELADEGYTSVFQQLVACLISTRTRDELTIPSALALFREAPTADAVTRMTAEEIDECIFGCAFHMTKAMQIHAIADVAVERFGGDLPCDFDVLTSLAGIGPKCAGLALGVACGAARIGVDVHVHRITNRWGYVATSTPAETLGVLERVLPREHWVRINRVLVPFGKHICTAIGPRCSTCPVADTCQRVGVTSSR